MASPPGTPPPQESPNNWLKLTDLPKRFLENESKASIPIVTVHMKKEETEILIGDQNILYPFRVIRNNRVPYLPSMKVLMTFLTNRKIEKFEVKTEPEVFTEFIDSLESLALKICTKKFFYSTNHPDSMVLVLQHLNLDKLAVLKPIKGMKKRRLKMTEHLKAILNKYILKCAIAKYQVYKCYTMLCKILGHFKLPYVEFEWKYYQHYYGNSDLMVWKRSEEMSSLPEKMKASFQHVLKKLDIIDRLILRKTSREMRQLVDGSNFHCDEVVLNFYEKKEECFIVINKWNIFYDRKGAVFYVGDDRDDIHLNVSKKFVSDKRERLQMMCYDAALILKNPNWAIKNLKIDINFRDASSHLIAMLQSLNNQTQVERVEIDEDPEDGTVSVILPLLKILDAKTLKEICLNCGIEKMEAWREIWKTEQWKNAEVFETGNLPNEFPFERLFRFKKIGCGSAKVGTKRLDKIRDNLVKSAHFEKLEIQKPTYPPSDKIIRIFKKDPTFSPKIGGFLIPNSKDCFRLYLETDERRSYIRKKNCFIIERTAVEEDSVDSEVERLYPNATAMNKFILKAALKDESVFESYKEWCQNPENPKIDFLDFEWRFYKFYHGERDLSIEKSSQSSVTFNDLTNEVLEKIVERTHMLDRLAIRKVCRNLREIVDKTNADCKTVFLCFGSNEMIFGWQYEYIKYLRAEDEDEFGYEVHCVSGYAETKTKQLNLSKDEFSKMMMTDATNFLKTPNQKIGKFAIDICHNNCPMIKRVVYFLNSLNFKIRATELHLAYSIPFHSILPFFDSKHLKKLCLNDKMRGSKKLDNNTASKEDDEVEKKLEKIMTMKIWTKIESFKMEFALPGDFQIVKFFHLKRIIIKLMELTEEGVVKIREILLKSPQFERACFTIHKKVDVRGRFIGRIMSQDASYDSETHRFLIPYSQEYYQLTMSRCWCGSEKLYIRRTTLENENSNFEFDKDEEDYHEAIASRKFYKEF